MNNAYYGYNEDREVEIDLIDLIWKLLMQWKAMLIVCLLMALIVSGIKLIKDKDDYNAALERYKQLEGTASLTTEERIDAALSGLSADESAELEYLLTQQELMSQQREVLNNSILFSNPSNQRQLITRYLINSESADIQTVADAYATYLHSNDTVGKLKEVIEPNIADDYIAELISTSSDKDTAVDESATSMIYTVSIILPEKADAEAVSATLSSIMSDTGRAVTSIAGDHSLRALDTTDTHVYAEALATAKRNAAKNIADLKTSISNTENALTDEQTAVYETLKTIQTTGVATEDADSDTATPEAPTFSRKFALAGFFIGAVLYAGLYMILLVINRNIASASTAESYTCTRLLGEVYCLKERSGLAKLFESKTVAQWRYKDKLDSAAMTESMAATIDSVCGHRNINNVTLLCSGIGDDFADILSRIKEKCKSNGRDIYVSVINADTMEESVLSSLDNAIYALSSVTKTARLDDLMRLCNDYGVEALGSVYMEEV